MGLLPMLGWYIDIVIGYFIRTLVRFFRIRRSETWPVEKAVVSSVSCPKFAYGGPYGELGYTYTTKGDTTLVYIENRSC
jgi:hypothetical protein